MNVLRRDKDVIQLIGFEKIGNDELITVKDFDGKLVIVPRQEPEIANRTVVKVTNGHCDDERFLRLVEQNCPNKNTAFVYATEAYFQDNSIVLSDAWQENK